jgi:hypothetical protein
MLMGVGTVALACLLEARGAAPSSAPAATAPATQPLRRWIIDLSDPVASVRQTAEAALLELTAADLPALREEVTRVGALDESQKSALRDIVAHVYLSGRPYPRGQNAFVGVTLANPTELLDEQTTPVIVESRLPGFCGYRALREGDVITEFTIRNPIKIRGPSDFIEMIRDQRAGVEVKLAVQRQGRSIIVPVKLDARPEDPDRPVVPQAGLDELIEQRRRDAGEYWDKTFAPVVEPH